MESCTINKDSEKIIYDGEFANFFENRVKETIEKFSLVNKEDKLLLAVSGGKDSTVMVYVMKKLGYDFECVTVDAHIGCYTEENLKNIRKMCQMHDVKLHEIEFRKEVGASLCFIRDTLQENGHDLKSCTVCGVIRRYLLNRKSRELGATKLVLGHNMDDEAQGILMNLLKNKVHLSARSGPINGVIKDSRFVSRIKPLYLTPEKDVVKYSKMMNFPVHYGKCPCSVEGFRNSIKDFLNELEIEIPEVKKNILLKFLERLPSLREKFKTNKLPPLCEKCGEASVEKLCRVCSLLDEFKHALLEPQAHHLTSSAKFLSQHSLALEAQT